MGSFLEAVDIFPMGKNNQPNQTPKTNQPKLNPQLWTRRLKTINNSNSFYETITDTYKELENSSYLLKF